MIIPYLPAKLVKVFYFSYGIYARRGLDITDIEASALIMLAAFATGGQYRRDKPHRDKIYQIGRFDIGPYESIQNFIVPEKDAENAPLEYAAFLRAFIVIPDPAFIAAELLVCTSIADMVSAFQTDRAMPFALLVHYLRFYQATILQ